MADTPRVWIAWTAAALLASLAHVLITSAAWPGAFLLGRSLPEHPYEGSHPSDDYKGLPSSQTQSGCQ